MKSFPNSHSIHNFAAKWLGLPYSEPKSTRAFTMPFNKKEAWGLEIFSAALVTWKTGRKEE